MKRHAGKWIGLFIAACLVATSASARGTKLDTVEALAQALAAKLPRQPGAAVYVAFPRWKGKQAHYQLRKEIGSELASALATAEPDEKVITPAEAADIMAKKGFRRSDVYLAMEASQPMADYVADTTGATTLVTGEVQREKDGLLLTVEARELGRKEWLAAELKALIPLSHELSALLAQPEVPLDEGAGVYAPGIGGVGEPTCVRCNSPRYPSKVFGTAISGTVWIALTVGSDGKVSDAVPIGATIPGMGPIALKAVRSWRFRPAHGPDGKIVPVRLIVELQFRMY